MCTSVKRVRCRVITNANDACAQVRIGFFHAQGGCVQYTYSVHTEDLRHQAGVYLGASIGGAALIVIVIAAITRQRSSLDDDI